MTADKYNSKHDTNNLGLYVHIPFCQTKCRYCSFYSEPVSDHDTTSLIKTEISELHRYTQLSNVKTIYIGGGSPSAIDHKLLLSLVEHLKLHCPAATEFTIELNPGQVDKNLLTGLYQAGVNRLSFGVQSFSQAELDFLGRTHTVNCICRAVAHARDAHFENISLDLIFAIPNSDLNSWTQTLRQAIELQVEHISAYALSYEKDTPLNKDLHTGIIKPVDQDLDRQMYELTIDQLANAGFQQYEISNFAKPGCQCQHNLNYWSNGPYIGIGPAASSYLNAARSTNIADIRAYTEAVTNAANPAASSETLSDTDRACETAVLNLRRINGIDLAEFKNHTGFDATELFAEPIRTYTQRGLIEKDDNRIYLTRQALGIADSILCDFATI